MAHDSGIHAGVVTFHFNRCVDGKGSMVKRFYPPSKYDAEKTLESVSDAEDGGLTWRRWTMSW